MVFTRVHIDSWSRKLTSVRYATICTGLAAAIAGCAGSAAQASHHVAKSALARDTAPNPSAAELQSYATSNLALTHAMLTHLRTTPAGRTTNLAYSPLSVALALSMPYAGARGETATEMATAMQWSVPQPRIAKVFNHIALAIAERASQAQRFTAPIRDPGQDESAPAPNDARVRLVNALWASNNLVIESGFLDTMAVDYGAGVTLANFAGDPDGERRAINRWVESETRDKIANLLPDGSIQRDTRLVLVNAMHLKLPWAQPMRRVPSPLEFTLAGGAKKQVPFVTQTASLGYFEDAFVQAVRVPLLGGSISALVIVPKRDLESFESGVTVQNLKFIRSAMQPARVSLTIPAFNFTTRSMSLKEMLKSLGMARAFAEASGGGTADFSGISKTENLKFDDVVHKAMVALDEQGIEAAAATAVTMMPTSAFVEDPKTLTADKPFLFMIEDEPTQSVLFAGHVYDPTAP